jgi:glycolate oxidase FAD binding subunit
LGFTAVSGRGESFVAGGRVVKNVTGYDLPKLMCGSWGQLAILTQLTLKVLPRPRETITLAARDSSEREAFAVMTHAARSQCEIAAAAHLPSGVLDARSHTLLRLEGFGPSVEARARALAESLPETSIVRMSAAEAASAWAAIPARLSRDTRSEDALWRIVVPGTAGARLCESLVALQGRYCVDWAGGLIWARVPVAVTPTTLRALAEECGGHASMLDAPLAYRASASALHPEQPAVAALAQRIKIAFDPASILDPHRFAAPHS